MLTGMAKIGSVPKRKYKAKTGFGQDKGVCLFQLGINELLAYFKCHAS